MATDRPARLVMPKAVNFAFLNFGFSAKNTLGLAQALYERHKVLTYPRTDSRALPEDYGNTVKQTLGMLQGTGYRQFADEILNDEARLGSIA